MEKLHFKTNIQLKSIIGKDLINDENIAILELVKNAFDADAKKVEVEYLNLRNNDDATVDTFSEETSRLFIKDNGIGMDLEDIQEKWLNIAFSGKKNNSHQHNRRMAGAKGVGRFSCDRLGEYLNLYAKKKGTDNYILLKIDWKKFEIEDSKKEIQSIDLDYELLTKQDLVTNNIPVFENGVLLEIIKLRSNWVQESKDKVGNISWNTDKLVSLKKYLEKLINPNQAFEKNDFTISLDAPEFQKENKEKEAHSKFIGHIENTIFEKLDFKTTSIESEIIEKGTIILTTLKDKGEIIFWVKEKNEFYPLLKNIKISLFYLNTYTKSFFAKQTGIRSFAYGSIFLFINGFRVPPYGEINNDWLGLEHRKGQGYARFLGTRDLVGRIEILDDDNDFHIISSREGVAKYDSFRLLTEKNGYFLKTFRRLEKYVVDGLSWDSVPNSMNNVETEKKIMSGKLKEDELIYKEDDLIKKRRVYESIYSIISAKTENVTELYINEDLILSKINEEKINTEKDFKQLIIDFGNKKIDGDALSRILLKKAIENKDLEKQINDLSKYTTNEATTKAIEELQAYKSELELQAKIIEELKNELELGKSEKDLNKKQIEKNKLEKEKLEKDIKNLKVEKQKAEQKAKEEETKRKQAEKEKDEKVKDLELEKLKTEFYKKQSSPETDALIHHVKNNNLQIKDAVSSIITGLNKQELSVKEMKDLISTPLYKIFQYNEKSLKATDLILQSDLEKADAQKINLPSFIDGYFKNTNFDIKVHFSTTVSKFQIIGSKLDLALILDNLVDNATKWKAKNIWVDFIILENTGVLNLYDDGNGLDAKFINNPEDIFKFRNTAKLEGTGFGLYLVRETLTKMNANIYIDTPTNNIGMNFKIIFK